MRSFKFATFRTFYQSRKLKSDVGSSFALSGGRNFSFWCCGHDVS